MSKHLKKGTLVAVRTLDIEHDDYGWEPNKNAVRRKPGHYSFVGWVIADTKRCLILSAVVSHEGKTFCSYRLPKGPGMSVERLKVRKP